MTHLIHFGIRPRPFGVWAARRGLSDRRGFDPHNAMHVLLSALFGKGAFQPYRLFQPETGPWSVYGHSARSAEELAETARLVGAPDLLDVVDLDQIRGKPLPEAVPEGRRIGFDVRLFPVMRRGDGRVRDAFAALRERQAQGGAEADPAPLTRERVYRDWFAERISGGAELETFRISAFSMPRMVRSGKGFIGPDLVAQGTLLVTGPDKFRSLLHEGVGRARAYGFGLLLLRPADPERPF